MTTPIVQTISIGDREVEVRELTFGQLAKVTRDLMPLVDALQDVTRPGKDISLIDGALWSQPQALRALMIAATDMSADEVDALTAESAEMLALAAYSANADFFLRRLVMRRKLGGGRGEAQNSTLS